MTKNLTSLLAGILFGLGLAISQMVNPQKVIAFLDITGNWDPSLMLVMFAAVVVSFVGFRLVTKSPTPLAETKFRIPDRTDIDSKLIIGAALFGVGWGLAGYCPGPAISALVSGSYEPLLFVAAMIAGFGVKQLLVKS
jgi:uncharacterized membrane protein YedE/YeeE